MAALRYGTSRFTGDARGSDRDQPIFDSTIEQAINLDCGGSGGVLQFGFRPCWEPDLHAGAELGPTRITSSTDVAAPRAVRLSNRQSNEGGRSFGILPATPSMMSVNCDRRRTSSGAPSPKCMPRGFFNDEARSALSRLLSLAQVRSFPQSMNGLPHDAPRSSAMTLPSLGSDAGGDQLDDSRRACHVHVASAVTAG